MSLPKRGDRVRLVSMCDDFDPVPVGTEGLVTAVCPWNIAVQWDNGRRLSLLTGIDEWEVLSCVDGSVGEVELDVP